jgi:hypothetical protein
MKIHALSESIRATLLLRKTFLLLESRLIKIKIMRKVLFLMTGIVWCVVVFVSCSKGNQVNNGGGGNLDCSTVTNKDFAAHVNPIIQTFCNQQGCHDVASVNGPGPLTNYTQVFNARVVIRGAIASGAMPKNATLTTAQKNSIICWIDSGAQNN